MASLEKKMGIVAEWIQTLDHCIIENDRVDQPLQGYIALSKDNNQYRVVGNREMGRLEAQYQVDIGRVVGSNLDEKTREDCLNSALSANLESDDELHIAGMVYLSTHYDEELNEMQEALGEKIRSHYTTSFVTESNLGTVNGYTVAVNVFPEDGNYSIATYDDSIRKLIHDGEAGNRFLEDNLEPYSGDVDLDESSIGSGEDPTRSFQ